MSGVVVYYLSPGHVAHDFCQSLVELTVHEGLRGGPLVGVVGAKSGATLAASRNTAVESFLDTHADWLLFIDADMIFPRDAIERLMKVADEEHPIVGGLCYGLDQIDGPFATLYKLVQTEDGPMTARMTAPGTGGLFGVDATGTGFLLIHRRVFEVIKERNYSKAYPWFQESELGGSYPVGEDITFCLRARACGFPVYVDLDLRIGHVKEQIVVGAEPTATSSARKRSGNPAVRASA